MDCSPSSTNETSFLKLIGERRGDWDPIAECLHRLEHCHRSNTIVCSSTRRCETSILWNTSSMVSLSFYPFPSEIQRFLKCPLICMLMSLSLQQSIVSIESIWKQKTHCYCLHWLVSPYRQAETLPSGMERRKDNERESSRGWLVLTERFNYERFSMNLETKSSNLWGWGILLCNYSTRRGTVTEWGTPAKCLIDGHAI